MLHGDVEAPHALPLVSGGLHQRAAGPVLYPGLRG